MASDKCKSALMTEASHPDSKAEKVDVDVFIRSIAMKNDHQHSNATIARRKKIGISVILLATLFLLGLVGTILSFTMFTPDISDHDSIFPTDEPFNLSNLAYSESSSSAQMWSDQPLNPYLKVYFFNYSNYQEYLIGTNDRLEIQEIGPYVYVEHVEKTNVVYEEDNTISYKEKRTHVFQPHLSHGSMDDQIVIPNIPLLSMYAELPSKSFFERLIGGQLIQSSGAAPFVTVAAHNAIWGYDDRLIESIKQYKTLPFERFGLLVKRAQESEETMTIYSGVTDLENLNMFVPSYMTLWDGNECNLIDGTDGHQFPPRHVEDKLALPIFNKAFCRKFLLFFDSEVTTADGFPAYRYKISPDTFVSATKDAANYCYCSDGQDFCKISGIFDASKCLDAKDSIFISFPHFLNGDDILFNRIDGLTPNAEKHLTFSDIHPVLGAQIGGASRFQINVRVPPTQVADMKNFETGQILPVIWLEVTSGDIPVQRKAMIQSLLPAKTDDPNHKSTTDSLQTTSVQKTLRYSSLAICSFTLISLIALKIRNK